MSPALTRETKTPKIGSPLSRRGTSHGGLPGISGKTGQKVVLSKDHRGRKGHELQGN